MRALLLTPAFWAPENRAALIKSPVDLVVGTLRQFDIAVERSAAVRASLMRALGQNLFSPPNVKGWPGGEAWINSTTLLARKQFLERAASASTRRAWRCSSPATREKLDRALKPGARARDAGDARDLQFSARDWLRAVRGARNAWCRSCSSPRRRPAILSGRSPARMIRCARSSPIRSYQLK